MFEEMSIADEFVASGAPPHKSIGVIDLDAFNKQDCFEAPASVPSVPSLHYKNKLVNECYASKSIKRPEEVKRVSSPIPENVSCKPTIVQNMTKDRKQVRGTRELDKTSKVEESLKKNNFLRTWGCASILVVDDSPFNILILHEIFGKVIPPHLGRDAQAGEPCVLIDDAANGLQAFKKVKETAQRDWWRGYEVVLMDLNMPVMDGATSAQNIVNLQEDGVIPKSLKVIALTAYDSPEFKTMWAQAGMKGFLNKPVSIEHIEKVLKW